MTVVIFRVNLVVSVHCMELQIAVMKSQTRHQSFLVHLLLAVHLSVHLLRCPMFLHVFFMLLDVLAIWHILSTEAVL